MKEEITQNYPVAFRSEDLKKWLLEYDNVNGEYPEHQYEGMAVWKFMLAKLKGEKGEYIHRTDDIWDEWLKEMKILK